MEEGRKEKLKERNEGEKSKKGKIEGDGEMYKTKKK